MNEARRNRTDRTRETADLDGHTALAVRAAPEPVQTAVYRAAIHVLLQRSGRCRAATVKPPRQQVLGILLLALLVLALIVFRARQLLFP